MELGRGKAAGDYNRVMQIEVGGRAFYVTSLANRETTGLRFMPGRGGQEVTQKLRDTVEQESMVYVSHEGGKSGSGFSLMGDLVLKYGLRTGAGVFKFMNEPAVFRALAPHIVRRCAAEARAKSLLNRIYLFLELKQSPKVIEFDMVAESAYYGIDRELKRLNLGSAGVTWKSYDLKGKSRTGGNKKFVQDLPRAGRKDDKWGGELPLNPKQCGEILASFDADVKEVLDMAPTPIIDYSLLVGVADFTRSSVGLVSSDARALRDMCNRVGEPLCFVMAGHIITVSIIDYLNALNRAKKMENLFKLGKFKKYHKKMRDFIESICPRS